ncbi:MAG: Flp pilus assembly protein CpaB [Acidobacteriaceae bacterium]|jgi:pilus assembly protein CpaB
MNRRVTSALIALGISGIFTYWLSTRMTQTHVVAPIAKSQYVAAAANLEADQVIRAENLRVIDWPATVPLSGAFTNPGALIGRIVLYPLSEGEPILERQLSGPGAGIGITAKIPNGMRLIALRTDEVVGVAGFLLPGTHVDVLVTLHTSSSTGSSMDPMTFTVLQDAQVLSAGQKTEPDPEGKATVSTVVTLLVKPEDAERVVLASNQGSVHFVLRNGADREEYKGPPALLAQLSGYTPPAPVVKEVPKLPDLVAVKTTYTVETILGKTPRMDDFQ